MTTATMQAIANQKIYIHHQINQSGYHCAKSVIPNQWLVWKAGTSHRSARRFRLSWSEKLGWWFWAEDGQKDREANRLTAIVKLSIFAAELRYR